MVPHLLEHAVTAINTRPSADFMYILSGVVEDYSDDPRVVPLLLRAIDDVTKVVSVFLGDDVRAYTEYPSITEDYFGLVRRTARSHMRAAFFGSESAPVAIGLSLVAILVQHFRAAESVLGFIRVFVEACYNISAVPNPCTNLLTHFGSEIMSMLLQKFIEELYMNGELVLDIAVVMFTFSEISLDAFQHFVVPCLSSLHENIISPEDRDRIVGELQECARRRDKKAFVGLFESLADHCYIRN